MPGQVLLLRAPLCNRPSVRATAAWLPSRLPAPRARPFVVPVGVLAVLVGVLGAPAPLLCAVFGALDVPSPAPAAGHGSAPNALSLRADLLHASRPTRRPAARCAK